MDTTATKTVRGESTSFEDYWYLVLLLVPLLACFLPVGLARVATAREPWHFQEQAPAGEELGAIVSSPFAAPLALEEVVDEDLPFFPFAFVVNRPPGRVIDYHSSAPQVFSSYPRHYTHYVLLEDGGIWKWTDPLDSFEYPALWYLGAVYAFITFTTPFGFFILMTFIAPGLPPRLENWVATRIHPPALPGIVFLCLLWLLFSAVVTAVLIILLDP